MGNADRARWIEELAIFYEELDRKVRELYELHGSRLLCRKGCHSCCVEGLTVFEREGENIGRHHAGLLLGGDPHPEGACAFLDSEGACRVYEHRPYVCRTQGLPLRWIEQAADGTPTEMRDICPLNDPGEPLETLPAEACWTIGPFEGKLAGLQASVDGGELRRVSLRSLFRESGG